MWTRWLERTLAGEPSHGDGEAVHRMLVAETDRSITGCATFGQCRDPEDAGRGELAGLYVLPGSWGAGIGHALVDRAADELRGEGSSDAYLWVLHGNERAIRFYERHGWHADGTERFGEAGGATQLRELRHVRRLSDRRTRSPA